VQNSIQQSRGQWRLGGWLMSQMGQNRRF